MSRTQEFPAPSPPAAGRRLVWLALAVAVAVRLVRALLSVPGGDECLDALVSLRTLQGHWPIFFFGQDYMGTLDAVLAAPLYALWPASPLLPAALAVLYNFLTLLVLWRVLARFFPPAAQGAGLFYYALPPAFFVFWAGEGMNHYHLGLLLCALLLWLSLAMWRQGRVGAWQALAWGFMAGLAAWTNFQTAVVILPCAVFVLAACWRSLRPWPLLLALAGGLLGASPLLYYDLTHHFGHLGQAGIFQMERLAPQLHQLLTNALPIVLGFNTPPAGGPVAPGSPWFWPYLLVAALAAAGCGLLLWRGRTRQERGLWLPLLIALTNLGVVTASTYGWELRGYDQRYLMPLYLVLPFAWAALAQALARTGGREGGRTGGREGGRTWAAAGLVLLLLAVNFAGYFDYRGIFALNEGAYYFKDAAARQAEYAELRRLGIEAVYRNSPESHAYLSGQDPQFTYPYSARRLYAAVEADACLRPAFELPIHRSLVLMGVAFEHWAGRLFHDFQEPRGVERQLEPAGWRAHTLAGRDLGEALWDQDLTTGFSVDGERAQGAGFVLDLGAEQTVAGLIMLYADHRQGAGGLLVEGAGADGGFHTLRRAPDYWGPFYWSGPRPYLKIRYPRADCYFPAQRLRYLRVTHLRRGDRSRPWTVNEVLLLGPGPGAGLEASWTETGRRLLEAVRRGRARRVYADAWPAAYLRRHLGRAVWTLTANASSDEYGNQVPPPWEPLLIDPAPGSAVVIPARALGPALDLLRADGVVVRRREPAGRYQVIWTGGRWLGRRLRLAAVTASEEGRAAAGLARGRPAGGRWAPPRPQSPGPELTLDLGRVQAVARVELRNPDHPQDWPRALAWLASSDGRAWQPVHPRRTGPLAQAGPALAMYPTARQTYNFVPPLRARYLRLRLTGRHPVYWWSVQEVAVYGP